MPSPTRPRPSLFDFHHQVEQGPVYFLEPMRNPVGNDHDVAFGQLAFFTSNNLFRARFAGAGGPGLRHLAAKRLSERVRLRKASEVLAFTSGFLANAPLKESRFCLAHRTAPHDAGLLMARDAIGF